MISYRALNSLQNFSMVHKVKFCVPQAYCTEVCAKISHRIVVLAEGKDLSVVPEPLAQSQLGDRLHGQAQQVGTQRRVLTLWE